MVTASSNSDPFHQLAIVAPAHRLLWDAHCGPLGDPVVSEMPCGGAELAGFGTQAHSAICDPFDHAFVPLE
jgi:hypothetical protein